MKMSAVRRQEILSILNSDGAISIKEMSQKLGVSEMTIRRDLEWLHSEGLSTKVHGGAIAKDYLVPSMTLKYLERKVENEESKKKIAQKAVSLLTDGYTIFLDGGTTCGEIANYLPTDINLRVVTNSLHIHSAILNMENIEAVLLGGVLSEDKNTLDGIITLDSAKSIKVDIAFFSAAAFDVDSVMNFETIGLSVKKEMLKNSVFNVFVCDESKFGSNGFYKVADWSQIDFFISDIKNDGELFTELSRRYKNLEIKIV